ncbi:hypothetical protein Q5752_004522 [Cryptotrichosporon argae]
MISADIEQGELSPIFTAAHGFDPRTLPESPLQWKWDSAAACFSATRTAVLDCQPLDAWMRHIFDRALATGQVVSRPIQLAEWYPFGAHDVPVTIKATGDRPKTLLSFSPPLSSAPAGTTFSLRRIPRPGYDSKHDAGLVCCSLSSRKPDLHLDLSGAVSIWDGSAFVAGSEMTIGSEFRADDLYVAVAAITELCEDWDEEHGSALAYIANQPDAACSAVEKACGGVLTDRTTEFRPALHTLQPGDDKPHEYQDEILLTGFTKDTEATAYGNDGGKPHDEPSCAAGPAERLLKITATFDLHIPDAST